MTTLQQFAPGGWAEINSEGISTIYLSIVDEGMVTSPTDTPANTQFRPRVLNPEQFSIKRAPPVWPQANTSGVQAAAYGQLQIDNYDGAFDFLISADLRDTTVIFKLPAAASLLTGTTMNSAPTIATAIIDTASCSNEDVITLSLKDTIARLDKTLPAKFNPPFVDANAAGKMVPMSFGPFRNRGPLLIDTPNRLFQVHDAPLTSITRVSDMAAPLDPTATPPQYTLALSNSGLQLQAMPVGLLACEGCVVGGVNTSAIVPSGSTDVLNGSGLFPGSTSGTLLTTAWLGQSGYGTTSTGAPTGTGPYTVPVTNTGAIPANGTQVYFSDGTNKLLGTVTAGSTTTSIIVTRTDSAGTVTSIANGSPLVKTGAPTGWKFTAGTGSTNTMHSDTTNIALPSGSVGCFVATNSQWWEASTPLGSGAVLSYETAVLVPGSTYRISFGLYNTTNCGILDAGGFLGGVIVSSAVSNVPADYIAGFFDPLYHGGFQNEQYVFEFTVPTGGANRKLYFMFTPTIGQTIPTVKDLLTASLCSVKVQLLGQYVAQPLNPISMTDYFTEILVNRAGEASSVFSSADTNALAVHPLSPSDTNKGGTSTPADLVGFSCCFDQPPNILDALRMALDNFCATLFTDNLGVLRARRLVDPSDPTGRVVKADFTPVNVLRPIQVSEDPASMLTTLFGARRNWKTYNPSDFVTDQGIVTQNTRAMFSRTSQSQIRSMKTPASNYNFAIGALQFDTTIDVPNDCQLEADRVVGIWSPNVYSDGTVTTGKRRLVMFTATWDDPAAFGVNTTCTAWSLMFGDIVTLLYPSHGFLTPTYGAVLTWEPFWFAQKMNILVLV